MAYDERSFLEGLAAGLTATVAPRKGALARTSLLNIPSNLAPRIPSGTFQVLVSRVWISSPYPVTILYEYGPDAQHLERETRRASGDATLYHAAQPSEAVDLNEYLYRVSVLERGENLIRYRANFALFPYQSREYPGTPEAVSEWIATRYR